MVISCGFGGESKSLVYSRIFSSVDNQSNAVLKSDEEAYVDMKVEAISDILFVTEPAKNSAWKSSIPDSISSIVTGPIEIFPKISFKILEKNPAIDKASIIT